jgi:hypothetical protein
MVGCDEEMFTTSMETNCMNSITVEPETPLRRLCESDL